MAAVIRYVGERLGRAGLEGNRTHRRGGDDPLGYVISLNLHRRHLTTEQRAIVASRLANLHRGKPVNAHTCAITQSQAAEALSVSRRSVQHARAIEKEPELVEQVWRRDHGVRVPVPE